MPKLRAVLSFRVMRKVAYRRVGWKIKAHGESVTAAEEDLERRTIEIRNCMHQYVAQLGCITFLAFSGEMKDFKTDTEIDPNKATKRNTTSLEKAWIGIGPWNEEIIRQEYQKNGPWFVGDDTDEDDDDAYE